MEVTEAEDVYDAYKAFTGKTLRAVANDTTRHFEAHPEELVPFPQMLMKSMEGGWMHLGADEGEEDGVEDRRREDPRRGARLPGLDRADPGRFCDHRDPGPAPPLNAALLGGFAR